ncbi:MAG: hypothetical protein GY730_11845, partial [bacterium]|nr:hypothetical protein [bacterium]
MIIYFRHTFILLIFLVCQTVCPGDLLSQTQRHGLSIYSGLHKFDKTRNLKTAAELGLSVTEYFGSNILIRGNIGRTFPKEYLSRIQDLSKTDFIDVYGLTASLSIFKFSSFDFFLTLGGGGDIYPSFTYPSLKYGAGINFNINNDWLIRSEITTGKELITHLGLSRKLNILQGKTETLSSSIKAPALISVYKYDEPRYTDIAKHWARNDILKISRPGLIKGYLITKKSSLKVGTTKKKTVTKHQVFKPESPLTKLDALHLVTMATKLHSILKNSQADIEYSIFTAPENKCIVDLYIEDKNGRKVRDLISKKHQAAGIDNIKWNGLDNSGEKIKSSDYIIKLKVSGSSNSESISHIKAINMLKPVLKSQAANINFIDIKNNSVINEAVDMGLIPKPDSPGKSHFKPDSEITRYDFITLLGKALYYLGADTRINADLSIYNDKSDIPLYSRRFLDLYISEFGYGGNENNNLEPVKKITRAEAAVLITRFLRWKKERVKNNYPFMARKVTVTDKRAVTAPELKAKTFPKKHSYKKTAKKKKPQKKGWRKRKKKKTYAKTTP